MNIYSLLKEKHIEFSLIYLGINELTTNIDVKYVIKNKNFIIEYYSKNFSGIIENFDNYIDYLVYNKVIKMKEIQELLKTDEVKTELLQVIKGLELINVNIGSVIQYISIHIRDIMNVKTEYESIADITMEIINKYSNGISEDVFIYLAKEYYYLLFNNYEKLQKVIELNEKILGILLSEKVLKNMFWSQLKRVLEIVKSLKERKYSKYKLLIDQCIEVIIRFGEKINENIKIETSLMYRDTINSIFDFLVAVKHKKAVEFENYCKNIKQLEEEGMRLYGKEFKREIPVTEIRNMLKSDIKWELKLLYLTHTFDKEDRKVKSILDLNEKQKSNIFDSISTNIRTNDFFSRSHQKYLECEINVGAAAVMVIFRDEELFSEYYKWYDAILKSICKGIDYNDNDLYNDFGLLYQLLNNLFYSDECITKDIESSLSYGPCMFICSLIEKILRIIYKYEKQKEEYINIDNYTLGQLLSENNNVIVGILGNIQVKHLRYFFLSDPDGKVGEDYRNRLAHWRDLCPNELNRNFVCKLFFVFMNVANSIFVYYLR